jgi:hypothetical protein
VAILPFKNLSGDPNSNFYEFSLADAVITELAQIKILDRAPVVGHRQISGRGIDPREAGQELRVHAVLSAGFIRSGDTDARHGAAARCLSRARFCGATALTPKAAIFSLLQDMIAERILEGLRLELSDKEQEKRGRRPTENAEAYEEYLRGRDNFGRFIFRTVAAEDCDAAIKISNAPFELDPHFALAHSGLGACYANRVFKGMGEPEDYTYAEAAFSKAFFYDPNVVEARVLMVMIYLSRGEKKKRAPK